MERRNRLCGDGPIPIGNGYPSFLEDPMDRRETGGDMSDCLPKKNLHPLLTVEK